MAKTKENYNTGPYSIRCNDCPARLHPEELAAHERACTDRRYREWKSHWPEKAEKWEKYCAQVFAIRDQKKKEAEMARAYRSATFQAVPSVFWNK